MLATNREMIRQVYAELERRLKMEWDDMQEIADCEDTVLTLNDYNNLREWLVGALQGIYSVFYSQACNWSDTVTFMQEVETDSKLITYLMEFKYEVLFNEAVYYYDAYINSRKILYKTHCADLEHGDKIIHTYATGAKSIITINYSYGTALPAHLLSRARSSSYWPLIISAF